MEERRFGRARGGGRKYYDEDKTCRQQAHTSLHPDHSSPPTTLKHNFLCSWPQDHRPRVHVNLALITPTKPDNSISGTAKQLPAEATLLYFTLLGGMKDGHAEKDNVYKL